MRDKIIISGVTGFVGSNLKTYLNKKSIVVMGVSRKENPLKQIISYKNCDLKQFSSSKAFIHLAGKAHDLRKGVSDAEYYKANTDLTIKLFNQFLKSDCKIFIYLSSVKAVAEKVENVLLEEAIPNPITAYGKSKLKAEQYILSQKLPSHKKVYILRPCMIHGPNNKGNLNLLYKWINYKIPFPLGCFKNKRSFLSVDNLSFVIYNLINKMPESGIFNLSDDDVISTNELVRIIAKASGKRVLILKIPKAIINNIALIGDNLSLFFNSEKLDKLTENYCVSNNKIKDAIGEKLPLTIYEGLNKTITSFK